MSIEKPDLGPMQNPQEGQDVEIDVSDLGVEAEGGPSLKGFTQELDAAEASTIENRERFARTLNAYISHPDQMLHDNLWRSADGGIFAHRMGRNSYAGPKTYRAQHPRAKDLFFKKVGKTWTPVESVPDDVTGAKHDGSDDWSWETLDEYNAFDHAVALGEGIDLPMTGKQMQNERERRIEDLRKYLAAAQEAADELKTIREHLPDVLQWAKERAGVTDRHEKEISTADWLAFKESLGLKSGFHFGLEHHMREKLAEVIDALAGADDIKRGNYYY